MPMQEAIVKLSRGRVFLIIGMACVESYLFGFLIDGWPSLAYMFIGDGVFSEFCNKEGGEGNTSAGMERAFSQIFGGLSTRPLDFGGNASLAAGQSSGQGSYPTCPEQEGLLNLVLIVANVVGEGGSFLCGYIFDRIGLRTTRLIQFCFMFMGAMLMTFTNLELSPLIFVGATFLSFSSMFLILTNTHLAVLAGGKQSAILGVSAMFISLCSLNTALMQTAYDAGVSRQTCFYVYAGITCIHLLDTLFLMPSYKVTEAGAVLLVPHDQPGESSDISLDSGCQSLEEHKRVSFNSEMVAMGASPRVGNDVTPCDVSPDGISFKRIVVSALFINHLIWFAFNQTNFWFTLGSFYPWISYVTHYRMTEVSTQTLIFQYANFMVFVSPLVGLVTDFIVGRREKNLSDDAANDTVNEDVILLPSKDPQKGTAGILWKAVSICPVLIATSLASALLCLASLFGTGGAGVAVSLLVAVLKGTMFTSYYIFCQRVYPKEHYGKLVGLGATIANILNLVEVPIFYWAQSSSPPYLPAQAFLFCTTTLTFIHPLSILIRYKTRKG